MRCFICIVAAAALGLAAEPVPGLEAPLLDHSIALASHYLRVSQKPAGNFQYEYNFRTGEYAPDDNAVRQAGATWGFSLLYAHAPHPAREVALRRAFAFWRQHSDLWPGDRRGCLYPGDKTQYTGTNALVCLALMDYLRSEPDLDPRARDAWYLELAQRLDFLLSLRREDALFWPKYRIRPGRAWGEPNGFYDGESLLVMARAARHFNHQGCREALLPSAAAMYRRYVVEALREDPDSPLTKGFYQWGSMAFYEIFRAGGDEAHAYGVRTIAMAHWMIDTHRVLERNHNTAYAMEGIAHAYDIARRLERRQDAERLRAALELGLYKLCTWQVGSPVANGYLRQHCPRPDPRALGGVMNASDNPSLRIDVTQHQGHALVLARRFLFPDAPRGPRAEAPDPAAEP